MIDEALYFGGKKGIPLDKIKSPLQLSKVFDKFIDYHHNRNWKLHEPLETLMNGGNCHDQTVAERYCFKKLWGSKYKVKCYFVITPNGSATHSFLTFSDNGKYFWFENAWIEKKGIHGPYANLTELKKDFMNQWCAKYKLDPHNTFIGPLKYTTPGCDIKEFCMRNVE